MSDVDLNNLEDETPAAPEAPPAPPAAEVKPPDAAPAEVEAVEVAGQKYVPLSAVLGEREKRKAAETKAARVDEIERWAQEKAPYIRVLEENPDLFKRPQPQQAPPPEAKPDDDPDAVEAAQLMDFYTSDGKPDVARGARWLKLQDKRAGRQAQQVIQPVQQHSLQQQANENYYRVMQIQDPTGRKPSEQAVRAVWGQVLGEQNGLATLADPKAAAFLAMAAMGMDRMLEKPKPQAPPQEPVVSESPGGSGKPPQAPLSALEESILKQRRMKPAEWAENTKGFQRGRAFTVEDD